MWQQRGNSRDEHVHSPFRDKNAPSRHDTLERYCMPHCEVTIGDQVQLLGKLLLLLLLRLLLFLPLLLTQLLILLPHMLLHIKHDNDINNWCRKGPGER